MAHIEQVAIDAPECLAMAQQLMVYNQTHGREYDFMPLRLIARNELGTAIGTLLAATGWDWMQVDTLYVEATQRRSGVGRELLLAAEQIAKERGCAGVFLDTFDFQARDFYQQCGYQVFGTLDGMPRGHQRYWMRKAI
jgi:GNAT superfamily N-acetyltransferase